MNNHLYDMDRKQFDGVLKVAKKAVKHGIYAVEKGGTAEMKKETYSNKEEHKKPWQSTKKKDSKCITTCDWGD